MLVPDRVIFGGDGWNQPPSNDLALEQLFYGRRSKLACAMIFKASSEMCKNPLVCYKTSSNSL